MIQLENISKNFGQRQLFQNISYQFPQGERVALVGANGAGKTSLLRIITGEEEASEGRVILGRDARLGYLPQEPNRNPKETVIEECLSGAKEAFELREQIAKVMSKLEYEQDPKLLIRLDELQARFAAHDGYEIDPRARRILRGLGFSDAVLLTPPLTLSGGWRMRLELAKIFLANPEVLLLDEPTNHLDLPSLAWVEAFLVKFTGTLIFVSHDRPLLNRLATFTVEISPMGLMAFRGNFDRFVSQKEARLEQLAAERAQIGRKKQQLEDFINRFGAKASKASQAQSKAKMLQRLQAIESDLPEEEIAATMSLKLPDPPKSARMMMTIKDLSIGYQHRVLAKGISLNLEKEMKIAVIGANGIGKSTFLKSIADQIKPLDGEVRMDQMTKFAYFAQDQLDYLNSEESIFDNVMNTDASVTPLSARQMLGSLLFRGDDVFKKVKVLSGGEKNRVGLACMLMKPANLLFLDEPTNHLDMGSVAVLAQALDDFKGSMIFVSHDRDFIDSVCTHVFVMLADGRFRLFEGNLESYSRIAEYSDFPNILSPDWEENEKSSKNQSVPEKQTKNDHEERKIKIQRDRKLQALEKKISDLKKRADAFDQEMYNSPHMHHDKLNEISVKRNNILAEIEKLEEEYILI